MKLEVGMFIRSPKGKIENINYLVEQDNPIFPYTINCTARFRSDIAKASHNIIDLIEVGDLCVIEFYSPRYEKRIERLFEIEYKEDYTISFQNAHCDLKLFGGIWSNEDKKLKPIIKSIVTKEQFRQMEYKVGE